MKTPEQRLEIIEKALKILEKWVDNQSKITDDDTILFDNINKRLVELETTVNHMNTIFVKDLILKKYRG